MRRRIDKSARTTLVTAATIISTVDNRVSTPRETRKDNWYPVKEEAMRNPEGQLIPGKADATRNPELPIGTRYHMLVYLLSA